MIAAQDAVAVDEDVEALAQRAQMPRLTSSGETGKSSWPTERLTVRTRSRRNRRMGNAAAVHASSRKAAVRS